MLEPRHRFRLEVPAGSAGAVLAALARLLALPSEQTTRGAWSVIEGAIPAAQIDALEHSGADGRRTVTDFRAYVDGVNGFLAAAAKDPTLMPAEYRVLGRTPAPWQLTDVVATAADGDTAPEQQEPGTGERRDAGDAIPKPPRMPPRPGT